ncbi:hypothetical protein E2C01_036972 [Portunus trituberculatus]|uniref:Uncharacterized protein n=1 Tax=Portunus trituberculatus TaxID=210409 RepID=A0A5B7FE47_PORTR|nr:hypothetical protein [Portunus trituberculatus]
MELLQRRYGQDATNTGERKAVWTGLRKKCCCVRREGGKEEVGMAYLSLSPLLPGPAQPKPSPSTPVLKVRGKSMYLDMITLNISYHSWPGGAGDDVPPSPCCQAERTQASHVEANIIACGLTPDSR